TGVHAAAIIKAQREGQELADLIYSSVVAHRFGREQIIEVGHMSGKSNVRYWCEHRGVEVTEDQVEAVFRAAKKCSSLLSEREIFEVLRDKGQGV
ncbi:MAG: isopropylmalate/homocitrate/citramalate synthase, partial [Kiritimatiellia bacterium]